MKTFIKLFLPVFIILFITSCAKTRDGIGLDTINAIVRSGKWDRVSKTFYPTAKPTIGITTELLTSGQYAEFRNDDKVHFFNTDKTELDSKPYSFLSTKSILFDGMEYRIQETLGGTITKMTLTSSNTLGKTEYLFLR